MKPVKAVLFDADGVLQLPKAGWLNSLRELCDEPRHAEEFLAEIFAAEKPCLVGEADFESVLAEILLRWRSSVSLNDALLTWTQLEPSPEVLDLVRALRSAGTTVALATNQQSYRANFMSNSLGYSEQFDHLLYSCELGHRKPSKEYFSSGLDWLMIDPTQALFIDDHDANVLAARECGLHAEVFHMSDGVGRLKAIMKEYGLNTV